MSERRYHVRLDNGNYIDCDFGEFMAHGGYGNSNFDWVDWFCVAYLVGIVVLVLLIMFGIIH